ncbi:Lipase [Pseudolycoriella hygida]|uniref:Lipase n=1 Tax=Pseudolycoriella hygida TaxID=35572 RepID=A0A9Q0MK93_9DIPT|nr:Lipase [Pseudolycoriella hygida]
MKIMMKYLFVLSVLAFSLGQNFPSADNYLTDIHRLIPSFDQTNQYDGPASISSAPITTTINVTKPTREEMMYYNYYAASVDSPFEVKTMDCVYCPMVKDDMSQFVVFDNSTHDTSVLVALSDKRKEIVVAFRGSINIWNCILDVYYINTSPDGADHIKIHKGFYIATMSLYDRVVEKIIALRSTKNKNYKLVLTGHSLGAAMARVTQFLFLHLNQFPGITMEVYTYGEPRSGNKYYVDFLNSQNVKTSRVTNRGDVVCHVAPTSIVGTEIVTEFYYHALTEYWIDGDQEQFADQSTYEDPNLSNSRGPQYMPIDHFSYFDVNYMRMAADLHEWLAIPGVLHPVDVFPPLPKPIQSWLSDLSDKIVARSKDIRFPIVKPLLPYSP